MELHMRSHHWEARQPDWPAAAVAGFIAGAFLMMLELLWLAAIDVSPWSITYKIAGIVMKGLPLDSMELNIIVVAVALATHYVLGIVFGMILAAIIAPFHFDSSIGMVLTVGAVFGLLLYAFNFYGMVYFFSWFAAMRDITTLVAHLIFGMAAAFSYWKLERRSSDLM